MKLLPHLTLAGLLYFLTILSAQRASAQETPAAEPEKIVEWVLHGRAESRPALKHRLTYDWFERTPQNAAPLYLKTMLILAPQREEDDADQIAQWLENTPLDELPRDEVRKTLSRYEYVLANIEIASHRDRCDWDLPIREAGTGLFSMLLPEAQEARRITRLLALQARLQTAEGKTDEALATVRTMLAFSRHVAQQPFLISGLVGMAMANMALHELEILIQTPHAPNLYWPLTDLPDPLISLRAGIDLEYDAAYMVLPELQEARTGDYAKEEWDRQAAQLIERLGALLDVEGDKEQRQFLRDVRAKDFITANYEAAKNRLLSRGHDREKIAAMPASRVVLLDASESYAEIRDEVYKSFNLPYPDAQKLFERTECLLAKVNDLGIGGRLAGLLLPAINGVNRAAARTRNHLDALRIVEAIRLYAAAHNELPESLEAITEAPIPMNAVTGKPFAYRREGDAAILRLEDDAQSPKQYRLRLAE